mmetsp:Transcript_109601/g.342756  ORF Transcript_109601/g.342756 Transcript_109601/m.342756 type:complete len:249 (+) Transcript_109601:3-749(+)
MQGMGWVMVLTVGVLYICALIGAQLVGRGWVVPSSLSKDEQRAVRETFKDIPDAVFNLFKAMNADLGGVEPLLDAVPSSKYIMMAFMVVTNWAIFSILTAVVSDNMAKVTEDHSKEVDMEEQQERAQRKAARLRNIFNRLDRNGDQSINIDEFRELLNDEEGTAEICDVTGLGRADLLDLFSLLAKRRADQQEETITCHDFLHLLNRECGQVTSRWIMKLDRKLQFLQEMAFEAGKERPTRRLSTSHF